MAQHATNNWDVPTHLQKLFLDVINGSITENVDGYLMRTTEGVEVGGQKRTLEWLYRQLWNCNDLLPKVTCDLMGLPAGSTYADAVRSELLRVDDFGVRQQEWVSYL